MSCFLWRCAFFVLIFAYLAALVLGKGFADPDAFYHTTVSHLLWQSGPLEYFSALDLTLVGQSFADLHFGFHVFVAPFTVFFGSFTGLRVASLVLAMSFLAAFYSILRRERISYPEFWVGLLVLSAPFTFRLLLGKATPLALLFQLLGTWAVFRRKPWLAFFCGAGFALSHGGWPYLAGSAVLILVSEYLYDRIVMGSFSSLSFRPKRTRSGGIYKGLSTPPPASVETTRTLPWKPVLAVWVGVFAGLVLHPNRAHLVSFAWTQIVTIGLRTPLQEVALGKEWLPASPATALSSLAPWAILLLLGLLGLARAPRRPFDERHARRALAFAFISSVLTALSFKSWRNVEYLVPMMAIWLASLWQLVDIRKLFSLNFFQNFCHCEEALRRSNLTEINSGKIATLRRTPLAMTLSILFFLLFVQSVFALWRGFHPSPFPDTLFRQAMERISERARPNDRVFHVWWDDLPMLFAADTRLRYVSGLDPTFLHVVDPPLSEDLHALMTHAASLTKEDVWHLIHEKTQSRFVFLDLRRDTDLLKIVESDERYMKIGGDKEAVAFEIVNK